MQCFRLIFFLFLSLSHTHTFVCVRSQLPCVLFCFLTNPGCLCAVPCQGCGESCAFNVWEDSPYGSELDELLACSDNDDGSATQVYHSYS